MKKGHIGSDADKSQKLREFKWLANNIVEAKTPEQEKKWRGKMDNWKKANPQYAKEIDEHYEKRIEERIANMTDEERLAYAEELEEELERREKVMK